MDSEPFPLMDDDPTTRYEEIFYPERRTPGRSVEMPGTFLRPEDEAISLPQESLALYESQVILITCKDIRFIGVLDHC